MRTVSRPTANIIERCLSTTQCPEIHISGIPRDKEIFLKHMWGEQLTNLQHSTLCDTNITIKVNDPFQFKYSGSLLQEWKKISFGTNTIFYTTKHSGEKMAMCDPQNRVIFAKSLAKNERELSVGIWSKNPEIAIDGLLRRSMIDYLIREKGALPLHASAIMDKNKKNIYLFLSNGKPSLGDRKGKSTLLAHYTLQGYIPLADDEVYICIDKGVPYLYTLPNYLKLRDGTLKCIAAQYGENKIIHLKQKAHLTTFDPITSEQTYYLTMYDFKTVFNNGKIRKNGFGGECINLGDADVKIIYLDTTPSNDPISLSEEYISETLRKSLFHRRIMNSRIPFIFGDFVPPDLLKPYKGLTNKACYNNFRRIEQYNNISATQVKGGVLNHNFIRIIKNQLI